MNHKSYKEHICAKVQQPARLASAAAAARAIRQKSAPFTTPNPETLTCSNPVGESDTTCSHEDGDDVPLAGDWYKFKDADDQLVCRGGSQVCNNYWNIQNVAAVCCSAGGSDQSVCYTLWYVLSTADTRVHDICCDGAQTCYQVTFQNVNTLSCRGNTVCQGGTADVAGNLYCDGQSIVNTAEAKSACFKFPITFGKEVAGNHDHCIVCKGDETCRDQDWSFPNGGNVDMLCTDLASSGLKNCRDMNLLFDKDACVELKCEGTETGSLGGRLPCDVLGVWKKSSTNPTVTCKCTGKCNKINTGSVPTGYSAVTCSKNDATKPGCGVTCSRDDTACCKGDPTKAKNQGHPNCGVGECTTSTTTGQLIGDPHIDTFDGQHYLLLKQGSFSFWRFSGSLSWCHTKGPKFQSVPMIRLWN